MKEVFELAAAIISSIGGASIIIIGLSSWLGKIWANRIFESDKERHTKEIEKFKGEISKELERLKVINEKNIFLSKLQFEKEFQIYLELWESLFDVYVSTSNLFPKLDSFPQDLDERKKHYQERYELFCDTYNMYSKTLVKYAPFYSKDMYVEFDLIRNLCHKQGINFQIYKLEDQEEEYKMDSSTRKEIYNRIPEELKLKIDFLQDKIRSYLIELRTPENFT